MAVCQGADTACMVFYYWIWVVLTERAVKSQKSDLKCHEFLAHDWLFGLYNNCQNNLLLKSRAAHQVDQQWEGPPCGALGSRRNTLQRSIKDLSFSMFKRPHKSQLIANRLTEFDINIEKACLSRIGRHGLLSSL